MHGRHTVRDGVYLRGRPDKADIRWIDPFVCVLRTTEKITMAHVLFCY